MMTDDITGTYYSFFESFPIVFARYNFDAGSEGLAFLSIAVAVGVAVTIYVCYLYFYVAPRAARGVQEEPEDRLTLGVICSFLLPIGLFIFAWTSNGVIPWIVPLVGIFIFTVGVFILIQLIFAYLPTVSRSALINVAILTRLSDLRLSLCCIDLRRQ